MLLFVLSALAVGASGCVQEDSRITLNPDGSGKFRFEFVYDPSVAARAAQGMGQSPEMVRAMLPDLETMLYATVGGARGVDVWNEARIEVEAGSKVRIVVAGYFKHIADFALGNPYGGTEKTVGSPPSPLDFGTARFVPDSAGIAILEFVDRDTASDKSRKPIDTTTPLSEQDRTRLEEGRMEASVSLAMMMSLFKDARFHREITFSGEIIDAGIFNPIDRHHVQVDASIAKALSTLTDLFRDDRVARRLILGRTASDDGPFGLLEAAAKDPEVDTLLTRGVFGRNAPTRVTLRPGPAQFDYAAESAAATAGQSARLREVLSRASAVHGSQATGLEVEKPEFNFALRIPPGWVRFAADQIQPLACLGLRQGTSLFALVIAESLQTPATLDQLEAATRSQVGLQSGVRYRALPRARIGGMMFGHVSAVLNNDAHSEYWLATRQMFCWQLVVFGPTADSTTVATAARTVLEGFRILDTTRTAQLASPASDVDRPALGYAVRGAAGWSAAFDTSSHSPLVDLVWSRDNEAIQVLPIRFEGAPPDMPALTRALVRSMDFEYPEGGSYVRTSWTHPLGEALELRTERKSGQRTWSYRLRVVRGRRIGFLVAGWYEAVSGDSAAVGRTLDAVELREPRGNPPAETPAQRSARAEILNSAGLSYSIRQSYVEAHRWFQAAMELDANNPTYVGNTAGALHRAGRPAEGLEVLSGRIERFPDNAALRLLLAQLRRERGDPVRGNQDFIEAIYLGLDDEDDLHEWLQGLVQSGHADLAIVAGTIWVERLPALHPRRWLAQVVRESGDLPRAITMMRELWPSTRTRPRWPDPATLNAAGEYARGRCAGLHRQAARIPSCCAGHRLEPDGAQVVPRGEGHVPGGGQARAGRRGHRRRHPRGVAFARPGGERPAHREPRAGADPARGGTGARPADSRRVRRRVPGGHRARCLRLRGRAGEAGAAHRTAPHPGAHRGGGGQLQHAPVPVPAFGTARVHPPHRGARCGRQGGVKGLGRRCLRHRRPPSSRVRRQAAPGAAAGGESGHDDRIRSHLRGSHPGAGAGVHTTAPELARAHRPRGGVRGRRHRADPRGAEERWRDRGDPGHEAGGVGGATPVRGEAGAAGDAGGGPRTDREPVPAGELMACGRAALSQRHRGRARER
jgi:hypothetical protein